MTPLTLALRGAKKAYDEWKRLDPADRESTKAEAARVLGLIGRLGKDAGQEGAKRILRRAAGRSAGDAEPSPEFAGQVKELVDATQSLTKAIAAARSRSRGAAPATKAGNLAGDASALPPAFRALDGAELPPQVLEQLTREFPGVLAFPTLSVESNTRTTQGSTLVLRTDQLIELRRLQGSWRDNLSSPRLRSWMVGRIGSIERPEPNVIRFNIGDAQQPVAVTVPDSGVAEEVVAAIAAARDAALSHPPSRTASAHTAHSATAAGIDTFSTATDTSQFLESWARRLIEAAGVQPTPDLVAEHVHMAEASITFTVLEPFLRSRNEQGALGHPFATSYRRCAELDAPAVNSAIDTFLLNVWDGWVEGCRDEHGELKRA